METSNESVAKLTTTVYGSQFILIVYIFSLTALTTGIAQASDWHCTTSEENSSLIRICRPTSNDKNKDTILSTQQSNINIATDDVATQTNTSDGKDTGDIAEEPAHQEHAGTNTTGQSAISLSTTAATTTATPQNKPPVLTDLCGNPLVQTSPTFSATSLSKLGKGPIEADADEASLSDGVATFKGNVVFRSDGMELLADKADYFRDQQRIELEGNIEVRSPDSQITGDSAVMDLTDNSSQIDNADYKISSMNFRGDADSVRWDSDDQIYVRDGSYTRCNPGNRIWQVEASNIRLDQNAGQGYAKNARLKLYNTPVAYLPYVRFPIGDQRQSGFLFPKLADTSSGADLALPYYMNIAPNVDATLAPRYKGGHGYLTEGEVRWLNRFDQWAISGSYIDRDESLDHRSRWAINVEENGRIGENISTSIRYSEISDADYFRDLNTISLSANRRSQLTQSASIGYRDLNWRAGASIRNYQTIDVNVLDPNRPYEKTPELWLGYRSGNRYFQPGIELDLRHTQFEHRVLVEGARSYGRASTNLPLRAGGIRMTPTLGVEQQYYDLEQSNNADDQLAVTAPYATLDLRSTFAKQSKKGRRSIEPALFYLYREITDGETDQQLIPDFDSGLLTLNTRQFDRLSRFSGYDRLEQTNQLAASINHSRFTPGGVKKLSATIGQIFYFQNLTNTEQRDSSAVIADLEYRPDRRWTGRSALLWDTHNDQIDQGAASIRYRKTHLNRRNAVSIVNLGYNYRRQDPFFTALDQQIEQAEFSSVSYLSRRWGLFGKYQHDLELDRRSESLAGLQYDDCCIRLRLVFRDGLIYDPGDAINEEERERSVFLQIELKGLAGVGRGIDSVLEESILDYRP